MREGPSLEAMMDRLAAIPPVFLGKGGGGEGDTAELKIAALLNDLMTGMGDRPVTAEEMKSLEGNPGKKPCLRIASILCHIYNDPVFIEKKTSPGYIRKFIVSQKLKSLGESVDDPGDFVNDPERREELCRLALFEVNLYPAGEDEKRAKERLMILDSVERKKILEKTRQAQERAREIREAMLRQEAEEAASKMSRE